MNYTFFTDFLCILGSLDRWGDVPNYFPPTQTTKKPTYTTKKPPHNQPSAKPTAKPRPDKPDTCDTSYDAITFFRNSEIWIFKGEVKTLSVHDYQRLIYIIFSVVLLAGD